MTSKEAFEKMVELCNLYHHTIVKDTDIELICGYPIDNIRRDLEVLEILKKHFNSDSLIVSLGSFISFYIYKDDKDFKKVKEWLENEIH